MWWGRISRNLSVHNGKEPSLVVHPLGIDGKEDPVLLVFNSPADPSINMSLVDLGSCFRLIVNEVVIDLRAAKF